MGSPPIDTAHRRTLSALGWGATSSTWATTTSVQPTSTVSTPSTSWPRKASARVSSATSRVGRSTNSRSQLSETFMRERSRRELVQEAQVVVGEVADVVDPVADHRRPLDTDAEGEAGDLLGVVAGGGEHGGVDHATAEHLQPSGALAHPAVGLAPVAVEARHVQLGRRLGEREEVRSETDLRARPEELLGEVVERAFQVGESDVLVYRQPLDLVEDGEVGGVDGVGTVGLARGDDVHGRLVGFHPAHLDGRG